MILDNYNIDVLALTETCIHSTSKPAELINTTPTGYSIFSTPRSSSSHPSKPRSSGGTAFLLKEPVLIHNSFSHSYSSFEYSSVTLKLKKLFLLCVISTDFLLNHPFPTFLNLSKPIFLFPLICNAFTYLPT